MSTVKFSISNTEEQQGAVIFIDGEAKVVGTTHPQYSRIQELLLAGAVIGEETGDELVRLIDAATGLKNELAAARLGERLILRGNALFFDGAAVHGTIVDQIVRLFQEGQEGSYTALVRFLERLANNPSEVSRNHLYDFLAHHGVTITEDGLILANKSVKNDFTSAHAGAGTVTWPDGRIEDFDNAHLPNNPGNIVSIPRETVDEDRNSACSVGLHVGAYSYAKTFSQKLLYILVDPRDVVAVPHDASSAKVRVSQYRVLAENEVGEFDKGYVANKDLAALTGVADVPSEVVGQKTEETEITEENAGEVVTADGKTSTGVLPTADGLTADERKKVDEFKQLIPNIVSGGWTRTLSAYGSKRVTSKQRPYFKIALEELGLK